MLDFTLLPKFESMSIFSTLPADIDERLKGKLMFSEFYQRANSALMFLSQIGSTDDSWRNEAYLRAGLNEFYGLEGAAKRALSQIGKKRAVLPWPCNPNPLFQVMYFLRGTWVHVEFIHTHPKKTDLISTLGGSPGEPFSVFVPVLKEDTIDILLRNREVKKVKHKDELEAAMLWLLDVQNTFGIAQVFKVGVELYCLDILKKHR